MKSKAIKYIAAGVGVVAVISIVGLLNGKSEEVSQTVNTTNPIVVSSDEILKFRSDAEDKGIIKRYVINNISNGQFEITYIDEQGKLKNEKLKDVYVMGDVKEFEGATIVVKTLSKNMLTNDQLSILAYSLNKNTSEAESMVERLQEGATVKVGFIMETEEVVVEEEEVEAVEEVEEVQEDEVEEKENKEDKE